MTDLYMIYLYKMNGLHGNSNAMIAMITINVALQIILVNGIKKMNVKKRLIENLITILLLRPFVDAWRVHTKNDDGGKDVDAMQFMLLTKAIELATESIPGCVLQCYVLLLNPSLGSSR